MEQNNLNYVQNMIDYRFKNINLLEQAFTRRSYSAENGGADNEVLEFIGDKVLDYIVVKQLAEKYGKTEPETGQYLNQLNEGELTDRKAWLVQKKTLARRIDYLGFADYLIMGKSDQEGNVNEQQSVKEDLFEAIIGAIALDSEWDIKALERSIEMMLDSDSELEDDSDGYNYVGELQNWALNKEGAMPMYHTQAFSTIFFYTGPYYVSNTFHIMPAPRFMCYLRLNSYKMSFIGFGDSEKAARMDVAKLALEHVEADGLQLSIRDELENPSFDESISQLEILSRRGYFSIPSYDFKESHDQNGNPIWNVKCHISECDSVTTGESSSKKEAKKIAAYKMLQYVLKEEA